MGQKLSSVVLQCKSRADGTEPPLQAFAALFFTWRFANVSVAKSPAS